MKMPREKGPLWKEVVFQPSFLKAYVSFFWEHCMVAGIFLLSWPDLKQIYVLHDFMTFQICIEGRWAVTSWGGPLVICPI